MSKNYKAPFCLKNQKMSATLAILHPLCLLSVVDHYNRVAKDSKKRVVGALLGSREKDKQVDVCNSFAIPFEEKLDDPSVWFLGTLTSHACLIFRDAVLPQKMSYSSFLEMPWSLSLPLPFTFRLSQFPRFRRSATLYDAPRNYTTN